MGSPTVGYPLAHVRTEDDTMFSPKPTPSCCPVDDLATERAADLAPGQEEVGTYLYDAALITQRDDRRFRRPMAEWDKEQHVACALRAHNHLMERINHEVELATLAYLERQGLSRDLAQYMLDRASMTLARQKVEEALMGSVLAAIMDEDTGMDPADRPDLHA